MMIKRYLLKAGLVILLLWLFFPRISRKWNIIENTEALKGKRDYLNSLDRKRSGAPHVLIILADDLGRNDLKLYDGIHGLKTPHIESLASRGVTFTDASASSPICAPSRAGMLTGRIQNRSGFDSQPMQIYPSYPFLFYYMQLFMDTDEMHPVEMGTYPSRKEMARQGVPQSEIFIQEILQNRGYDTALVGKWHLGYGESQHPVQRGFNNFYGFLEAFTYFADPDREDVVSYRHDKYWEKHIWNKKRKGPGAIQRNGITLQEDRHLSDAIAEESLDFIRHHLQKNREQPFFLFTSFSAPHTPFQELKRYYDRFPGIEDKNRRIYAAMISHLDDGVGEILEGLEELGIREETLIFFASDNGGASYTGATENGNLAAGKMSQFEGGLEIPMILSWPGQLPEGIFYEEAVSLMDVFPTVLESAGLPLPDDRVIDGINLIPFLTGETEGIPHPLQFWKSGFNLTVREGFWKMMYNSRTEEAQLYNLKLDRGETLDVSDRFPELTETLLQKALDFESQCRDPLWPRVMDFEVEVNGKSYLFAT